MKLDRKHNLPLTNPPGPCDLSGLSPESGSEPGHKPKVSAWSAHIPSVDTTPIVPTEPNPLLASFEAERYWLPVQPPPESERFLPLERLVPDDNGLGECIARAIERRRTGAARLLRWQWDRRSKEFFRCTP